MPRKREVDKRLIIPDPKYKDALVARFVNGLMRRGKKSLAESILYNSFDIIGRRVQEEPLKVFHKAVDNVRPLIQVKSRRVGGATYQVPVEVRPDRRTSLAIRWLIQYAKDRPEKSMEAKLAGELLDAFNHRGGAIKKREDTHRMAEANKAFAHYRW
ncbi:MAG: 30S ribosomal protein S7 [Desulfobacca sp. 4484_104]|nr:MAG: 30S ribosomal protein S7 [Desulfobacca sp. 4484_104]RLA88438.1 MAG: 30S ribosomal protein S7 [Deltaproteobacteria bacterium]